MDEVVAGVDCSTQSTKVVCVEVSSGRVLSSARAPHRIARPGPGASETEVSEWEDALAGALHATRRAREVRAISVAAQQHGLCLLGGSGAPLRPAVLWNDVRSADAAASLRDRFGAEWWASSIGLVPVASFTVTKWEWLRAAEPEVAGRVAAVRLPHDLLVQQLCGRGATDRGDASGTGWWSVVEGAYSAEVLDAVELDASALPDVLGPQEAAGTVTIDAAERFGLSEGTLVGCGTGDNAGAALGLGLAIGEPAVSLGTSGTAYAVAESPVCDPSGVVAGFADATGRYLPLAATLNATLAVDRFADWLGVDREDVAPDSGRVVVAPFLDGERTPNLPQASGTVIGLTHATTPAQVLRAVYEGVVVSLLEAVSLLGVSADAPLVLIGGGARGEAWRDVVRSLSGRAVIVPAEQELVAMGAAAQAAALVTGEAPEAVARRWDVRRGEELDAVEQDAATLERHRVARERLLPAMERPL
ncbi:MAG TPA: xylulokinase [Solirubrobacteraceae bacterium]|nr:xylulokinase [Solirubrobacteraceae bacterium]